MKKGLFFLTVANLLFVCSIFAFQNAGGKNVFVKNNGQWVQEVKYLAQTPGMNIWITDKGVVYDYYKISGAEKAKEITKFTTADKKREIEENIKIFGNAVFSVYENSNTNFEYEPQEKRTFFYNYFFGQNKNKWAREVPCYKSVTAEEVYRGINIRYYFDGGLLRYDFEVSPGADVSQIKLKITGAEKIIVNEKGELILTTAIGEITHGEIFASQYEKKIECGFKKISNDELGISIAEYDKTKKLLIDPLVYGSYIAGSFGETINSIAIDENNNAIIAGESRSADFPTTPGAHSETLAGAHDVIVTKFNQDATELVFSTFIGGVSESEEAKCVAINNSGEVYITGITWSTDYPATTFLTGLGGGQYYDAFVSKFDGNNGNLIYSTYLGGSGGDEGFALSLDDSDRVYITGFTGSNDFPTTLGAFSDTLFNTSVDIFITRLKEIPVSEVLNDYSTFVGGGGQDEAHDMAIDENANVYLTGLTKSTNFPVTANAVFDTFAGGLDDAYVLVFGINENDILYSTFIGGSGDYDYADGLAIDNEKNIYITGTTYSSDFPSTQGAFQQSFNGGDYDCFVTKINTNEPVPVFSTFLGTSNDEQTFDIYVDNNYRAFVTGYTRSNVFPLTSDVPFDYSGDWDGIITGFSPDGGSLVYSTYFGGTGYDNPTAIVMDSQSNIYITGNTYSNDLPVSSGAFQDTSLLYSMQDGFIAKIDPIITAVDDGIYSTPTKFALSQNYPNPFNPSTTIKYSIPAVGTQNAASVQLKIYDILGREIATLVNEKQKAGNYKVLFDASKLSSGIYFYTLHAGSFTDTRKMLLLR